MKRLLIITMITTMMAVYINFFIAYAVTSEPSSAWARPGVMTIKRLSDLPVTQSEPGFLNNMDCTLNDFRLPASSTMQAGCFTETALGLMEGDTGVFIFNGTDEGLRLLPYAPHQIVSPWPRAGVLVSLSPLSGGNAYLDLYTSPLSVMRDERDWLGRLTAKRLLAPPDLQIRDSTNNRLVINPQTLAFSDGGSWLVAETSRGVFVRINLATLDIKTFAPAYTPAGHSGLFQSRLAISQSGRYVAIFNKQYSEFKVYDLSSCPGLQNCEAYDYRPVISTKINNLQTVGHVRFLNEGLISFEARANGSPEEGIYLMAPTEEIEYLIDYLALGDSYTSGEGAFNYLNGTDTSDNSCHLSARSYPLLIRNALFNSQTGQSVACSGAVIKDISSTSGNYRGQIRNGTALNLLTPASLNLVRSNFLPGYIAQQHFVSHYQPRIVTASVGGNDVGFGDILEQCLTPRFSLGNNDCFNTYEDRLEIKNLIDRTVSKWVGLYDQLMRQSPGSHLYIIGYPDIVADTGRCALNVHLSQAERLFARELVAYINAAVRQATVKAGAQYVDIYKALEGHRLCETASHNVAVNGVTAGRDSGILGMEVIGRESYHPNALGHELIKQAILEQTDNFFTSRLAPATSSNLLEAPKSGRPVLTRLVASDLASRVVERGAFIMLRANGAENGLRSNTSYQIRLDGPTGPLLGSVLSTPEADLETSITLPDTTLPGGHTIDIIGENQAGEQANVTQPIYVPDKDDDTDGDGQTDNTDSCPAFPNSGSDADQDSVDDVCDGFIDTTPQVPVTSEPTIGSSNIDATPQNPNSMNSRAQAYAGLTPAKLSTSTSPSKKQTTGKPGMLPASSSTNSRSKGLSLQVSLSAGAPPSLSISWARWLLWGAVAWIILMILYVLMSRLREYKPRATYALSY